MASGIVKGRVDRGYAVSRPVIRLILVSSRSRSFKLSTTVDSRGTSVESESESESEEELVDIENQSES